MTGGSGLNGTTCGAECVTSPGPQKNALLRGTIVLRTKTRNQILALCLNRNIPLREELSLREELHTAVQQLGVRRHFALGGYR